MTTDKVELILLEYVLCVYAENEYTMHNIIHV